MLWNKEKQEEAVYVERGKNLFDKNAVTDDAYLDVDGNVVSNTNNYWVISDFIAVNSGKTYTYQGITTPGDLPYSAYYDKDKNFIQTFKQQVGTNVLTIPNNVYFIRFSINKHVGDNNTFQIEKGDTATGYEEHVDTKLLSADDEEILNVEELKAQIKELTKTEEWKTLATGIKYRRVRNRC